jgi:preprotein translocase subunit SecB
MAEQDTPKNQFSIQKLYVKDVSFESPSTPEVFSFKNWEPKIELNLNNTNKKISEGIFEVVLSVTATVKHDEKTAFLVEIHQGGIFQIMGFNEQDTKYILGSQCMNILFPYAREVVSDLTTRGGFPPLLLNPVNFDAVYAQAVQQQSKESGEKEEVKH